MLRLGRSLARTASPALSFPLGVVAPQIVYKSFGSNVDRLAGFWAEEESSGTYFIIVDKIPNLPVSPFTNNDVEEEYSKILNAIQDRNNLRTSDMI